MKIDKELIESLVKGIESGEHKTLTQYSGDNEKQKIFDEGQVSALNLLLEIIEFKEKVKVT